MLVSQFSSLTLALLASIVCLSVAAQLPDSEVQALREIAKALGKTNWNFSVDPCSGEHGWIISSEENAVSCSCSYANDKICHVTSIVLEAQSLPGTLPKDLSGLPFLQQLDLKRNFLNGTIPPEWGSSKLVSLVISGNRITGSIPKELGNISTLESLELESNLLTGELPAELGKLSGIRDMYFLSNNLSGELPPALANLVTLENFKIGSNQFSGAIPNFIQNWTKLKKLDIVGSGLSGPIPPGISKLIKITDLRITDLSGPETTFPGLENMKKIKTLYLRNCNIKGSIPEYLKDMSNLTNLDLSFNKLSGEFPSGITHLHHVDNIIVTGNMLTGPIPETEIFIDLSYNNFTDDATSVCQQKYMNLFASSSGKNISHIPSCLRTSQCTNTSSNLYINCGGPSVSIKGIEYEADNGSPATSASFSKSSSRKWGVITTGMFDDDNHPDTDNYILENTTRLTMENPELYMTARLTPLSLTYYAFCLGNGSYTVKLHFAETKFTNNQSYSSVGRRVFDVYIQGKRVLKDFNIADEAGGVGKVIIRKFFSDVRASTLEIRFYWAGKGTTIIPKNGDYGVLVSAISIAPTKTKNRISNGAIIGIAAAGVIAVLAIGSILWWMFGLRKKSHSERDLEGLDLNTGKFTLRQIKAATKNFDEANKIGEGGFGSVYKGLLADGTIIAVKQLSSKSKQGNREFLNEIGMISALQHPHLVKLYGCCVEGDQLSLVYEFMQNNNVGRALFGPIESQIKLNWPRRSKICIGIARGLAFLHEESRLKIVHRDIKATNVLLDKNLNPKISDFGLAKLDEEDNTHMSTRIAGTYGYMAPEYAMRGHLTDKADVYSYGIVVLEIVTGRNNTTYRAKQENFYVLDWALFLKERGDLMELVDPRLGTEYNKEEVLLTIKLALRCASVSPEARPSMSGVLSVLEGNSPLEDIMIADDFPSKNDLDEMRRHYEAVQEDTQTQTSSLLGPSTVSTSSMPDLYPINPDSDYWKTRN